MITVSPGVNLVERLHAANARPAQALNLLRIVDQRPQRHAGELLFGALESLEHRAPHAEAKSGMLSDCELPYAPAPAFRGPYDPLLHIAHLYSF